MIVKGFFLSTSIEPINYTNDIKDGAFEVFLKRKVKPLLHVFHCVFSLWQEATYIFRPGLVPAYRQMFYQLIDIEEPEVQAIMHENDGQVETFILL